MAGFGTTGTTIAQILNTSYMYREVSSNLTYLKTQFIRTVTAYTFPAVGSIRLSYANTTETARFTDLDENDTFQMGIY